MVVENTVADSRPNFSFAHFFIVFFPSFAVELPRAATRMSQPTQLYLRTWGDPVLRCSDFRYSPCRHGETNPPIRTIPLAFSSVVRIYPNCPACDCSSFSIEGMRTRCFHMERGVLRLRIHGTATNARGRAARNHVQVSKIGRRPDRQRGRQSACSSRGSRLPMFGP